jgi:hypothetical protein
VTRRRHHQRFALSEPRRGTLEVLDLVDLESGDGREFFITTRAAAEAGEEVTLYLADAEEHVSVRARVVESRLHMVNGEVCHQIRLARLDETPPDAAVVASTE